MQAGRAANAKTRRSAYSEWVRADAEQFRRYRAGEITHDQWRAWSRANPMPELPSGPNTSTEEDA
jgi:hypothetical protein